MPLAYAWGIIFLCNEITGAQALMTKSEMHLSRNINSALFLTFSIRALKSAPDIQT